VGRKGFVTDLLAPLMPELAGRKVKIYACGPHPMLMALARLMTDAGYDGELSVDHVMCCGVGACFACVVKVKADNEDGWRYARTCREGPVFKAGDVYTDGE
jgi:dihydroorotate dehydrogenase electron transfer subunit